MTDSSYQHQHPSGKSDEDLLAALNSLPSSTSTDRPSMGAFARDGDDYGSLAKIDGSNGSLIQMKSPHSNNYGDNDFEADSTKVRAGRMCTMWYGIVSALLVVAGIVGMAVMYQSLEHGKVPNSIHEQHGYISKGAPVLSSKRPVEDLKIPLYTRSKATQPNPELFQDNHSAAVPTNAWYQNVLLAKGEPKPEQRVYPVPYMLDMVGPIPGLRLHHPIVIGGARVVQLTQVLAHGLTLGAATKASLILEGDKKAKFGSKKYSISKMTPLGITLEWKDLSTPEGQLPLTYSSSIVRGMPYATMQYNSKQQQVNLQQEAAAAQAMKLSKLSKMSPHKHLVAVALEEDDVFVPADDIMLPTVASEISIVAPPLLDGKTELVCHNVSISDSDSKPHLVHKEIKLIFRESDYTWLVFVSRPVYVQCVIPPAKEAPKIVPGQEEPSNGVVFALQFLDNHNSDQGNMADLVVRLALANDCTFGGNPSTCGAPNRRDYHTNQTAYAALLREHAEFYPGPDTGVSFDFIKNETTGLTAATHIKFNWNVQSMKQGQYFDDKIDNDAENRTLEHDSATLQQHPRKLLMFALPHHQDMIEGSTAWANSSDPTGIIDDENQESSYPAYTIPGVKHGDTGTSARFCTPSLLGPVCLVEGSTWSLREANRWTGLRAPRPPHNKTLTALAQAFQQDIKYKLPAYYQRGAGDTYFSGKMLAKFGRILVIGEELSELCSQAKSDECGGVDFPNPEEAEFQDAVARFRSGVEIWINGTGETPFVYDDTWGGLVSCGCDFKGNATEGICRNQYPDCPAFSDPGLNFGNAFYNDHHFHLGYHIYAAAVAAHFDPQWGRDHFERVLLLIRDIGNPSPEDVFFPMFRHKDWYQGSSWASGIAVSPLNGRNQESSSEAIASYEAIALYGMEMAAAWKGHSRSSETVAEEIQNYGELLAASELRSADRYWHVIEASKRRQYPVLYKEKVVGMLWNMMAQFQTWFGPAPYLAIGIQLLPLTAVSEERDTMEWVRELYEPFHDSCQEDVKNCQEQGWSVLVLAILATVGHRHQAIEKALALPSEVFESAGGNGHSLTNTLWYLATRPDVLDPLVLDPVASNTTESKNGSASVHKPTTPNNSGIPSSPKNFNCSCPETCDAQALARFAIGHTCRDRIVWLMVDGGQSEEEACHTVGSEFPGHCAACDPNVCSAEEDHKSEICPPCSKEVCGSNLGLCPVVSAPFLCTEGPGIGGCRWSPWLLSPGICSQCCELSLGCEDRI